MKIPVPTRRFGVAPPVVDEPLAGTLAAETTEELTTLASAFRDRAHAEGQRFLEATDSEHWIAVCFHTRERKEEFLRRFAEKFAPLDSDKYVSGDVVAEALGVELTAPKPRWARPQMRAGLRRFVRR